MAPFSSVATMTLAVCHSQYASAAPGKSTSSSQGTSPSSHPKSVSLSNATRSWPPVPENFADVSTGAAPSDSSHDVTSGK